MVVDDISQGGGCEMIVEDAKELGIIPFKLCPGMSLGKILLVSNGESSLVSFQVGVHRG